MQIEPTVDGVTGRSDFAFKATTFFVTEKDFADSFAILTKVIQHVESTRWIGKKNTSS